MSLPAEHYRKLAAQAREESAASSLPQVQLQYLRSAQHFDAVVAGMECVAQTKARNEAARAELPSHRIQESGERCAP